MTNAQNSGAVDTRLWCLHHIGSDDVHPAPDFATAQAWANWANDAFASHADISRFVVAVWPWDAQGHAANLSQAIADFTLPTPAPSDQAGIVAWMYITHLGQAYVSTFRRTHYDGYPLSGETPLYAASERHQENVGHGIENNVPPFMSAPTFDDRSEKRVCINGTLFLRADFAAERFAPTAPTLTAGEGGGDA